MNKKLFMLLGLLLLVSLDFQSAFSRIGLDPNHMEVVATLPFANEPLSVAVNEVTGRIYVGDETGFSVIDSETNTILDHISLGFGAEFISVNSVANHVYIRDSQDGAWVTHVLDGATYSVIGEIPAEDVHRCTCINPTMKRMYIADISYTIGEGDIVWVYDTSDYSLVSSIEMPGSSTHPYVENLWIAVNPQTNLLYVTWTGDDSIRIIDCKTNEVLKSAFIYDRGQLLINSATGNVYSDDVVLDGTSLEELARLPAYMHAEAVNPSDNTVICKDPSDDANCVYILDGTSHEPLASVWVDDVESIDDVAVNTVTGKIYLLHKSDKKVSVIEERSGAHNHVVINEFEVGPPVIGFYRAWVELYNPTSSDLDIGDWKFVSSGEELWCSIPSGTVIEAGGYYFFRPGKDDLIESDCSFLMACDEWLRLEDSVGKVVDWTPIKSDMEQDYRTWQRSPDGCDHWVFQESAPTANPPPVADAGGPYEGEVDSLIWFNGSDSHDPDWEIILYEWDFGDATTETGAECCHTYTESGTYTVTLAVTDAVGDICTDQTTVTVLSSEVFPIWILWLLLLASAIIIGITVTVILLRRRRK
jgi:DNA-binding beta-propeller fold protein YncE